LPKVPLKLIPIATSTGPGKSFMILSAFENVFSIAYRPIWIYD